MIAAIVSLIIISYFLLGIAALIPCTFWNWEVFDRLKRYNGMVTFLFWPYVVPKVLFGKD